MSHVTIPPEGIYTFGLGGEGELENHVLTVLTAV